MQRQQLLTLATGASSLAAGMSVVFLVDFGDQPHVFTPLRRAAVRHWRRVFPAEDGDGDGVSRG